MFNNMQPVEVKWAISNRKHFESLDYEFTAYKERFSVYAKDMQKGSDVKVIVVCDYCNEDVIKTYRHYNKQFESSISVGNIHKDCCKKCIKHKNNEFSPNKKTISEDIKLLVVEDYNLGMTYMDIRRKYKISESVIVSILEKYKVSRRLNEWTDEKVRLLEEYYPKSQWGLMLEKLYPFDKQAIHTKAWKLGISIGDFFWTKEEEQLLIDKYEEKSFDELMVIFPNKTEASIQTKANRLGIRKKEKWTEIELVKLKNMYEDYPNEMLIEFFPQRNISSITDMAGALGLYKSENASINYKKKVAPILLEKLKDFSELLGRTPISIEINDNPDMPGILTYHRHFETYSNACKLAGLEVNHSMYRKTYHLESINGDMCLSKKEQVITNLLIENGISYQKEAMYKDIIDGYDEKNIRCDWLIDGKIIVEYFGMPEIPSYQVRMNEKIELCVSYGVPLVSLYSEDTSYDFKGLKLKLKEFGIQID